MLRDRVAPVRPYPNIVSGRRDPDRKMAADASDGIQMGAETQTQKLTRCYVRFQGLTPSLRFQGLTPSYDPVVGLTPSRPRRLTPSIQVPTTCYQGAAVSEPPKLMENP